ncbi:hypothetical protein Tco_1258562, partial [Tanacetum coccineum]
MMISLTSSITRRKPSKKIVEVESDREARSRNIENVLKIIGENLNLFEYSKKTVPEPECDDEENRYECFDYDDLHLAYPAEKSPKYDTCKHPIRNVTMVCGGDFRQLNMRLAVGACPKDVIEIQGFAEWILKVKDDELGEHYDGEVSIDLPGEILIDAVDEP